MCAPGCSKQVTTDWSGNRAGAGTGSHEHSEPGPSRVSHKRDSFNLEATGVQAEREEISVWSCLQCTV